MSTPEKKVKSSSKSFISSLFDSASNDGYMMHSSTAIGIFAFLVEKAGSKEYVIAGGAALLAIGSAIYWRNTILDTVAKPLIFKLASDDQPTKVQEQLEVKSYQELSEILSRQYHAINDAWKRLCHSHDAYYRYFGRFTFTVPKKELWKFFDEETDITIELCCLAEKMSQLARKSELDFEEEPESFKRPIFELLKTAKKLEKKYNTLTTQVDTEFRETKARISQSAPEYCEPLEEPVPDTPIIRI